METATPGSSFAEPNARAPRAPEQAPRRRPPVTRFAWVVWALTVALAPLALFLSALRGLDPNRALGEFLVSTVLAALSSATVGALIVARQPNNRIGWLFCALGMGAGLTAAAGQVTRLALLLEPTALPGAMMAAWVNRWLWLVGMVLPTLLLLLLFPTGRPPSPRWRALGWLDAVAIVLVVTASAFSPSANPNLPEVANPLGWEGGRTLLDAMGAIAWLVLLGGVLGGVASLLARFRRARGDERQALKWFAYAAALMAAAVSPRWVLELFGVPLPDTAILLTKLLEAAAMACLPVGAGIGVLRYRLWDIDLLIHRTLVYAGLTLGVIGAYVLVVGYFGTVFQARGDAVSLVATGLVAVLFQPLRERLQRGVNHLLYGQRDEPYAVLARLGQRLEASLAPDAVLPAIVQTVREALKVPYAAIALQQEGGPAIAAAAGTPTSVAVRLPLLYRQEVVGELLLAARAPGESFSAADRRLLDDLARQVGVATHAVRLTADLRRAREQLVTAREEERRRLRRDLHDGLGPALSSVMLKLAAARRQLPSDSAADALLAEARADLRATLADVRRLVYELRPPALDQLGLVHAIREQAERCSAAGLQVRLEAPDCRPPLPAAAEVAAFRIAQEALTNVVRHAQASTCHVRLGLEPSSPMPGGGALCVEIGDDGDGLPTGPRAGVGLASMRERAEELGGTCRVERGPAGGTGVLARLPLPVREVRA